MWDLTGNVSAAAIEVSGIEAALIITQPTTVIARIKDSDTWSPLHELKIIPQKTSSVVINEINYDSDADFDTEDWVEIYNNSDTDISLAGWKLMDSDDGHIFHFSQNNVLKQDSFLVVCRDTSDFKILFEDVDSYIGNIDFKFGNDGDVVRIFDSSNTLIDFVIYDNKAPWPALAAGKGATLELINPEYDNTQAENWQASKYFGSPGHSNSISTMTVVQPENEVQSRPEKFSLSQNYPNPFNPTTHIKYEMETGGTAQIKIYNISGQEVTTLVDEYQAPGQYSVQWTPQGIGSGVYLYSAPAKAARSP